MNEELFYDRTRNITGVSLTDEFQYTPTYGSSVSFTSSAQVFKSNDGYYQMVPKGINNLEAVFDLMYEVNETDAQKLANFYEHSEGYNFINTRTDPSIYNDIYGYCKQYSINHVNNQRYEVRASIQVSESPGLINWSGMNYLNPDFSDWSESSSYKKNDIVYMDISETKLNNFYYCTEDHSSSEENSPTGSVTAWTQEFFWEPDLNTSTTVKLDASEFDAGFKVMSKIKKNTAQFPIDYSFSSVSTKQLKSMLHFLENKAGYRRFKHQIKSVYNRPKVYICDKWSHTWKYNNSHDLKVSFTEDPMGVLPKNS